MDWELLETWGVEKDLNPKEICDVLEERQLTLLQMRRNEKDSEKKAAIADELKKLEGQLKQAKKEARKQPEDTGNASAATSSNTSFSETDNMAEMKKKLDALKRQEESRRKEEKAKAASSAADNSGSASDSTSSSSSTNPSQLTKPTQTTSPTPKPASSQPPGSAANRGAVPVGDGKQQLQIGIAEYNNGNCSSAFVIFNDLAQKGNSEAEYYLSQMFSKGLGTTSDSDKANFWLKKSADHKYAEAQFAYAMKLLSNRSGTDPLPKEGMQYLAKAADQDYQYAQKKYVDIVLSGYHDLSAVRNAIKYAARLQSLISDQYEISVYKNKEDQLKSILAEEKKVESSGKMIKVVGILSPIFLIFGFLYVLGGAHPNEWNNNALLSVFPDIPSMLIIPFHLFWVLILPVLTVNGQFGLQIITLCYACRSFYVAKHKTKNKSAFSAVSKVIIGALIVWHLLLVIIEGQSLVNGIIYFIIAIIVCRIFGLIFGKLANYVSNSKSLVKGIIWTVVIIAILVAINKFTANIPVLNGVIEYDTVKGADASADNDQVINAELVGNDVSGCEYIHVASITANSVLVSSSGNRYEAEYMIDGDEATSWQEGVDGAGEGQVFTVEFVDNPRVDYVVIYNGNHKSEELYYNNNRICSMNVIIDGQSSNVEMADTMDPQVIHITGAEDVSQIQFEIVSVYSGDKYNDTCVAEVQFLCE